MIKALTIVILRICAAYMVVYGLPTFLGHFGGVAEAALRYPDEDLSRALLTVAATSLVMGVALWIIAPSLVGWIVPAHFRRDVPESAAAEEAVAAGTFLIGVYFTFSALPRVLGTIALLLNDYYGGFWDKMAPVSSLWIQAIIGLGLMISAGRVALVFSRLRKLGQNG